MAESDGLPRCDLCKSISSFRAARSPPDSMGLSVIQQRFPSYQHGPFRFGRRLAPRGGGVCTWHAASALLPLASPRKPTTPARQISRGATILCFLRVVCFEGLMHGCPSQKCVRLANRIRLSLHPVQASAPIRFTMDATTSETATPSEQTIGGHAAASAHDGETPGAVVTPQGPPEPPRRSTRIRGPDRPSARDKVGDLC